MPLAQQWEERAHRSSRGLRRDPVSPSRSLGGGGGLWGEKGRAEDPAFREGAAPGEQSWGGACAETRDAWLRPVETSARSSGGRGGGLPRALRGGRSPLQDLWAARSRSRKVSQPQSGEGRAKKGWVAVPSPPQTGTQGRSPRFSPSGGSRFFSGDSERCAQTPWEPRGRQAWEQPHSPLCPRIWAAGVIGKI